MWVAALALWPVLRAASKPLPPLPKITDKKFIELCVSTHNKLRSEVQPPASNMRYMVGMEGWELGCRDGTIALSRGMGQWARAPWVDGITDWWSNTKFV